MNSTREVLDRLRVITLIIYVAIALWSLGSPQRVAAQQRAVPLTVLVFNYSTASVSALKIAERQANDIFHKAGLQVSWVRCPVPLTTDSDPACAAEVGLQDVLVRIVDHPQRNYFGEETFGFSIAPALATVYYGRALSVGNTDEANYEVPVILGSAMAHEIGHLLLGPRGHSLTGIMKAQWKRTHLEQAMKGRLVFSADQATQMRSNAVSRLAPAHNVIENEFPTPH